VLDLGGRGGGVFPDVRPGVLVVRLDLKFDPGGAAGCLVRGDAARLPFANGRFRSTGQQPQLEHFVELEAVVREMGRVARPGAGLYVAVPDAGTLTDRHLPLDRPGRRPRQPFSQAGRGHRADRAADRPLPPRHPRPYSSLSFLNNHNVRGWGPRSFCCSPEATSASWPFFFWSLRTVDRVFGSGWSRYGWEFHFGAADPGEARDPWVNVCVRCGAGHSEEYLREQASGWRKIRTGRELPLPGLRRFQPVQRGAGSENAPDAALTQRSPRP